MSSKRTDSAFAGLRRGLGVILTLVIVSCGWCHGVLYVEGGSMEPALHPGDVIVYRRYGAAPRVGRLAVFEHNAALVVHRVIGVTTDGGLRTRGDANGTVDREPVMSDAVRGEVVFVVPSGRLAQYLAGAVP